ncbi:MAG: tetratricopeptide repeat protein [Thermoflexibacter sp.]|jgi:tetratricopeptide (TPR) repeat protein|nr:tetratricopeptide repeat protein [Thermoflexibacter sp.]
MWRNPYLYLIGILVIISFVFYPVLFSDVIYWTGGKNLSNTPTIKWLGLSFHLINTILVYFFVAFLFKKPTWGLLVALLWGIHPLHADVVAWTSRQGNLFTSIFYLLSLLSYLFYLRAEEKTRKKWVFYGISILAFGATAYLQHLAWVNLLVFFILDFFEKRNWNKKIWWDKAPLIIVLVIGLQIGIDSSPSYIANTVISSGQKTLLSGYALLTYVGKFFVPLNSGLINPVIIDKTSLLLGILGIVLTGGFLAMLLYRKGEILNREFTMGLLFFLLHLLPALLIPTDGYLLWIAYKAYLPYIGLCMVGVGLYSFLVKKDKPIIYYPLLIIIVLVWGYAAWQRTTTWQSSEDLLTQSIQKYPNDELAYYLRGNIYLNKQQYEQAFADLDKANLIRPDAITTFQLSHTLYKLNDFETSIKGYERAIAMNPALANTFRYYIDMAFNYAFIYDAQKARDFLAKAETLANTNDLKAEWHLTYGMYYIRYLEFDKALEQCQKALSLNPNMVEAYTNIGTIKLYGGKLDEAITNLKKAYTLRPNDKIILGNLAATYRDKKDTVMANYYAQKYQEIEAKAKQKINK